jgi:hypothetical protein
MGVQVCHKPALTCALTTTSMPLLGADVVAAAFADVSWAVPVLLLLPLPCPLKREANFSPLRSLLLLVLVLGDEAGTSTVAEGEAAGGKPAGNGGIPPFPKGLQKGTSINVIHTATAPMCSQACHRTLRTCWRPGYLPLPLPFASLPAVPGGLMLKDVRSPLRDV